MDKVIACSTMRPEIEALDPDHDLHFMGYGLHRVPDQLREKLQNEIDQSEEEGYDKIRLIYGLCSHGISGLSARESTIIAPRVHDCISLLLGSAGKYQEEFKDNPGTIYLSRGWIDFGGDPLSVFEEYVDRVGEEMAREAVAREYKNYTRLVFVKTWIDDLAEYREFAREAAEFLDLDYQEIEGSPDLMQKLLFEEEGKGLAVFPPGRSILRHNLV